MKTRNRKEYMHQYKADLAVEKLWYISRSSKEVLQLLFRDYYFITFYSDYYVQLYKVIRAA